MLDSAKVKDKLTVEQVIKICTFLQGDDTVFYDSRGNPIFNTCLDHPDGNSIKLYYFPETKLFHCFTGDGDSYDIFELVCRAKQCEFKEAFDFIVKFFKLKDSFQDEQNDVELIGDWDIFQAAEDFSEQKPKEKYNAVAENLLEYFYPLAAPLEWQKEGITPEVMKKFGIRVSSEPPKVIIPHRDQDGNLIGIRGRSYDPIEVQEGKKYMPVFIEKTPYNHALGNNLYGLYENKETIKRIKRVFVVEAEKSVLQLASMYGTDNCWAVATCGSSFSKEQMDLLLQLGVEEVILGYDRDYLGDSFSEDALLYRQKLIKTVQPLLPYTNVSIIMDYDHLTDYKDSPTDKGREVFEQLFDKREVLASPGQKEIKGKRKC